MATADDLAPLDAVPVDWCTGDSWKGLFLDPDKVLAEINRLRGGVRLSLADQFAIAVITSTAGGWLEDPGAMRELARRSYAMARVMIEERERES